jgi:uncharacterized membrane protein
MNYLVVTLRLIHILSGVFWVGSTIYFGFFIKPTIQATADAGQKFIAHLVNKRPLGTAMSGSAILTVVAGGSLYWIDSGGLTTGWLRSGPGWGFGIGGLFALIGFILTALAGHRTHMLGMIASHIQGEPTHEQLKQFQAAQKQLGVLSPMGTIVLVIALICMATARYWNF